MNTLAVDPNTDEKKVGCAFFRKGAVETFCGYEKAQEWLLKHTVPYRGAYSSDYRDIEIIVEGQFYPIWKTMQLKRFNNIISLAHHAGRWLQIAENMGIGIDNVHFVQPTDWMSAVLGPKYAKSNKIQELQRLAALAHYPELLGPRTEHEYAAVCIGIYWQTKDWKIARKRGLHESK